MVTDAPNAAANLAGAAKAHGSAEPATRLPSKGSAWLAVAIMLLLTIISLLDRNLVTLLVPTLKQTLGLDDVQMGTLLGAGFAVSYAVGAVPFGWALDRFDRRKVICFGVITWSLATMASGLAKSYWGLFAARSAVGTGEAVLNPGSASMLADLFPPEKLSLPISICAIGTKGGQGVSLMVGGLLTSIFVPAAFYALPFIGQLQGWQIIFLIAGAPGLALAFLIFLIRDPRRSGDRAKDQTTFREYLHFVRKNPRLIASHHLGVLVMITTMAGMMAWIPSFFMRSHGMSASYTGVLLGLTLTLAPAIGLPIHGILVDRFFKAGRRDAHVLYLAILMTLSIPLGLAGLLVHSATASLVLMGCFFTVISGYLSLPGTMLQIMVPAGMRAKAASVVLLINGLLSVSMGPVIVAKLSEMLGGPGQVGNSLAICLVATFPISIAIILLGARPMREAVARLHGS